MPEKRGASSVAAGKAFDFIDLVEPVDNQFRNHHLALILTERKYIKSLFSYSPAMFQHSFQIHYRVSQARHFFEIETEFQSDPFHNQ